jgi:hypothetical protein
MVRDFLAGEKDLYPAAMAERQYWKTEDSPARVNNFETHDPGIY